MSQSPCPGVLGDRRIEAPHVQISSAHSRRTHARASASVIGRPVNDGSMLNIAELSRLTITGRGGVPELRLNAEGAGDDRRADPEGDQEPAAVPDGRRIEYLVAGPQDRDAVGREAQRIRLATQVGSGLVGACYVLDEPTIGLHSGTTRAHLARCDT